MQHCAMQINVMQCNIAMNMVAQPQQSFAQCLDDGTLCAALRPGWPQMRCGEMTISTRPFIRPHSYCAELPSYHDDGDEEEDVDGDDDDDDDYDHLHQSKYFE